MGLLTMVIFGCQDPNKKLIKKGNEIVSKVENYKQKYGHLPEGLESLGIVESIDGPFYYVKQDSINYMVYFGTTLGESMIYYSDRREWDYRLRGMDRIE